MSQWSLTIRVLNLTYSLGLVAQLKHEPKLFQLYENLRQRASPDHITKEERDIASGRTPMTDALAAHYGAKLDERRENIKKAFEFTTNQNATR